MSVNPGGGVYTLALLGVSLPLEITMLHRSFFCFFSENMDESTREEQAKRRIFLKLQAKLRRNTAEFVSFLGNRWQTYDTTSTKMCQWLLLSRKNWVKFDILPVLGWCAR